MNLNARILVVDDEPMLRRLMSDRMQYWGCTIEEASTGEEALEKLGKSGFDLILLDLKMPGMGGLGMLEKMREKGDDTDVVVLTAHGSIEAAVKAVQSGAANFLLKPADFVQSGAANFLLKPADFELLRNTVERVLDARRLSRVNEALVEQRAVDAPFVIGESNAMQELVDAAARAATDRGRA
jgi:DNA-binding NtrC family response regulator